MNDLAGKRVVVTGGAGFLGRQVVIQLGQAGVKEILIPRSLDVDLINAAETFRWFAQAQPEIVMHLAAEVGGIGANQANPGRYFYANMAMGLNVIEASRQAGVDKLVVVGTVCAYPKHTPVPFREDDLWNGYPEETNAPYGVAKRALLVMLQAYRAQYGLNGVYLLPANLYGPGDNFDPANSHVIPALIRKFIEARDQGKTPVEVWGSGAASREFLYVTDAARAVVLAAQRYDGPEPINVGTGSETTVTDLVALISELTGYSGEVVWDRSKPDGQPRRSLNTARASSLLRFKPLTDFRVGLTKTIAWWERQSNSALHP